MLFNAGSRNQVAMERMTYSCIIQATMSLSAFSWGFFERKSSRLLISLFEIKKETAASERLNFG